MGTHRQFDNAKMLAWGGEALLEANKDAIKIALTSVHYTATIGCFVG